MIRMLVLTACLVSPTYGAEYRNTLQPDGTPAAPKLRLRDPFYFASFDPTWSLRNRTSAPDARVPEEHGGHMDYGGLFVHTHATLLPAGKYANDHPEYF